MVHWHQETMLNVGLAITKVQLTWCVQNMKCTGRGITQYHTLIPLQTSFLICCPGPVTLERSLSPIRYNTTNRRGIRCLKCPLQSLYILQSMLFQNHWSVFQIGHDMIRKWGNRKTLDAWWLLEANTWWWSFPLKLGFHVHKTMVTHDQTHY
jgi:hypothetical protein